MADNDYALPMRPELLPVTDEIIFEHVSNPVSYQIPRFSIGQMLDKKKDEHQYSNYAIGGAD